MKKLGSLLLILSLGCYSLGCSSEEPTPETPPPAPEDSDEGVATPGDEGDGGDDAGEGAPE